MKKAAVLFLVLLLSAAFIPASFAQQIYSGLIVDARELDVYPSKSPKIYDINGNEIYGTIDIDPEYVLKVGIVQYESTIGDAIRNETAGKNPIVVRAIRRGTHPYKADIVISADDARWIRKANQKSYFLDLMKVVFII